MKTEVASDLNLASQKVQFDTYCKRILGNKYILAWLLKDTVKEFSKMAIEKILECIEGEIEIGKTAVNPGETNQEKITGISTEDTVPEEGTVYYDLRFFAYLPNGEERIKLIINVEAQKSFWPGYELVSRGIFYGARMISAQLGTEFQIPNYNDIKKVYSIWICMNTPQYIGNAVSEYHIVKEDPIPGFPERKKAYDKLEVIMSGLNENTDIPDEFPEILSTCFSRKLTSKEKIERLEKDYHIPMNHGLGEEMKIMCNLSEAIEEMGIEKGIAEGKIKAYLEMAEEGLIPISIAAQKLKITESELRSYLKNHADHL